MHPLGAGLAPILPNELPNLYLTAIYKRFDTGEQFAVVLRIGRFDVGCLAEQVLRPFDTTELLAEVSR